MQQGHGMYARLDKLSGVPYALREAGFTRIDNIREGMAGSAAGPG